MNRLSFRHVGDDGFYDRIGIALTGRFAGLALLHVCLDDLAAFADGLAAFPLDAEIG